MIDFIVSILQFPGEIMRDFILAIPLWLAKGLFILYPLLILIWIFSMEKSEVKDEIPDTGQKINLRPFVAISLVGQIVIYIIF